MPIIQYLAGHIDESDITEDVSVNIHLEYVQKEVEKIS